MILHHLDTVIGFLAVMLVASLIVTAGTQLAISLFGLRGANLRRSLSDLFETASDDRDARRYSKVIARRVLQQPLISGSVFSRFGIRLNDLPYVPADAAGKLRWAGSGIPLQPWLLGAASGFFGWPLTLFAIRRLFAFDFCAYADVVTSYIPFLSFCDHPWRSGAIAGAVLGGLLSRWRLASSIRLDELVAMLDKLSAPAGGTLPDPAQRAMLVIAGEARSRTLPRTNPVSAQIGKIFREAEEDSEGGVAIAVEKAVEKTVTQAASHTETRVEGLNLWFEHAMDRASQRFTVQARVITVCVSILVVFAAHLDAIRLFQSLSVNPQVQTQLAASADSLMKQAEQLQRAKEGSRTVVPEVYRTAMADVLQLAPPPAEPLKTKSRHSSHGSAAPASDGVLAASGGTASPNEVQISTASANSEGGAQAIPAVAQAAPEGPAKSHEGKSRQGKSKSAAKEREKPAPAPTEDVATVAAKMKASKALETRPGFASREDAVLWLDDALDGDPAAGNLTAAYEREVNGQLPSDADKLIDQAASIKEGLARSQYRLMPERWTGWQANERELPGLLVAIALLSLGAPLCYNLLKALASLRPMRNV